MHPLRKLRRNFLSRRAIVVLGFGQYLRYLICFIANARSVFSGGDLRPVDRAMGARTQRFRYGGREFIFDCRYCDEKIHDNSYAFGIAREIYIRDCYFKHQPRAVYESAQTVVDVGANRGAFSVMMAGRAALVLAVEAMPEFGEVIRHNVTKNSYTNVAVEICFVGGGGAVPNPHARSFTMEELLDRHSINRVDFMKMDIEGSEFTLFAAPAWLARVVAISLEVHPEFGDPNHILRTLHENGFMTAATDQNLDLVSSSVDPNVINFIYAWRDG